MKITFKDIVWIAIITLIIIFLSKCHRDEKNTIKEKAVALIDEAKRTDSAHKIQIIMLDSLLIALGHHTNQVNLEMQQANEKLKISEKTVQRLTTALKASKLLPVDTSFVTVSPDFVTFCDSLASESEKLTIDLSKYKNLNTALITGKVAELAIKDTIISKERHFGQECRKQFADLQTVYNKVVNDCKARNQVYVGAEILGTQNTIFQNVGAVISLKTKTNKLWQISSGLQYNGGLYARVNGNILISFKR